MRRDRAKTQRTKTGGRRKRKGQWFLCTPLSDYRWGIDIISVCSPKSLCYRQGLRGVIESLGPLKRWGLIQSSNYGVNGPVQGWGQSRDRLWVPLLQTGLAQPLACCCSGFWLEIFTHPPSAPSFTLSSILPSCFLPSLSPFPSLHPSPWCHLWFQAPRSLCQGCQMPGHNALGVLKLSSINLFPV